MDVTPLAVGSQFGKFGRFLSTKSNFHRAVEGCCLPRDTPDLRKAQTGRMIWLDLSDCFKSQSGRQYAYFGVLTLLRLAL